MSPELKGSLITLGALFALETVYILFTSFRKRRNTENESRSKKGDIMEVFFFPDKTIACKVHFLSETKCFKDNCKYSHGKTSLSELYRHLSSCRRTLDVCVFVLTCEDLVDVILTLHRRRVTVRVITDDEQVNITGSQIWKLRQEGICVRTDHSSYLMHHKFAIVDGRLLICGSFNWTRQAITGNQENVLILNHTDLVDSFKAEFEKLWKQFDPKNMGTQ